MIQLRIQYEEMLKNERNGRRLLETENGVLIRKLKHARCIIAGIGRDISHLLYDLQNKKKAIAQLVQEIAELHHEISQNDNKICRKERLINNLDKENQMLVSHKEMQVNPF